MSTTRVLHVIARMNVGGTAKYVSELVEKIPNSALATGFVQGAEIEDPSVSKLVIHRIPHMGRKISIVSDFKSWLKLRTLIKRLNPEIVHTHTFKAGLIGRLVGGEHKRVHTFHGHLFDDQSFSTLEKKIITVAERYLAKKTDILISVGKKVGVELRSAGVGGNEKWVSIPPGVDRLPQIEKSAARVLLNLDSEDFLVGWMARMTGVKNPDLMLEVARKLPNTRFVMAGGGELLDQVRELAPKNVAVIGWTDASTFWSAVDCAISTSDNEGMPIALIEAQLAGIPVVVTDVGSNSEVVEDGVTGLVTNKDSDSLVAALQMLISNQQLCDSMSDAAKKLSFQKFNLETMLSQHEGLYITLLTKII